MLSIVSLLINCYLLISTASRSDQSVLVKSMNSRAKCDQRCHIYINNKRTHVVGKEEPTLFTAFNYRISYGLPVYKSESTAIGYSIDIECHLRNEQTSQNGATIGKLRMHYSFDINRTPIEINMINCGPTAARVEMLIKNLTLTSVTGLNELKHEYLNMTLNLRPLRNKSVDMSMRLSLNRRLGDGCLTNLTLKKLPFDPKYLNDADEEDTPDNLSTYAVYEKLVKITFNKLIKSVEANTAYVIIFSGLVFCFLLVTICCFHACLRKMRCMGPAPSATKKVSTKPEIPKRLETSVSPNHNILVSSACTSSAKAPPSLVSMPMTPPAPLPRVPASNDFQLLRQQLMHKIEDHDVAARPSLRNLMLQT
jgi:hypothetical protein